MGVSEPRVVWLGSEADPEAPYLNWSETIPFTYVENYDQSVLDRFFEAETPRLRYGDKLFNLTDAKRGEDGNWTVTMTETADA